MQEKSFVAAVELYKKYYPSYSIESGSCTWAEEAGLHPYLSVSYPAKEKCQHPGRNNFSLRSVDFPAEYDPSFYTILVIGGSVAEQLGILNNSAKKSNYIEDSLQQGWISPTKKPFKVLNAAVAGSAQPGNAIQALLFSPLADVVVGVEGYNEFVKYNSPYRLESPANLWMEAAYQFEHPVKFYFLNNLSAWNRKHSSLNPFSYSYGVFAVSNYISNILKEHFEKTQEKLAPFPDYPDSWAPGQRNADYLKNHIRYVLQTNSLVSALNKKYVLFIQPVPQQFKKLSPEEFKVVSNIAYSDNYNVIRDNLLGLNRKIAAVEDLGHVFENETASLYVDHIHTNEQGLRILSTQIAERLAKRYGWKTR